MRILRMKNYEKYQSHKTKNPQWIKLYHSLLTDRAFMKLTIDARYAYVGLLLLASETGNCTVNDPSHLSQRLCLRVSRVCQSCVSGVSQLCQSCVNDVSRTYITPLIRSGFIVASRSTKYRSETETETETETDLSLTLSTREGIPTHDGRSPRRGKRAIEETDHPTEKHLRFAATLHIDPGPEWGKFKNYCLAHDKRYANFEAAFRNWLANAAERSHAVRHLRE